MILFCVNANVPIKYQNYFQSATNLYEHAHILCLLELSTKIREGSDLLTIF